MWFAKLQWGCLHQAEWTGTENMLPLNKTKEYCTVNDMGRSWRPDPYGTVDLF